MRRKVGRRKLGAIAGLAALMLAAVGPVSGAAGQPAPAAPVAGHPIVIGQGYDVASKVLGDVRRLNVRLPDSYGEAGRSFPVLILLDGGEAEDFVHIAGLAQINAAYGQGQEVIVVGVAGVDRRHDLTSPSAVAADRKLAPTSGGAAAYRRFLVEEVKPWVAAHYRTNGRFALMGESLAGLFTLETLLKAPGDFDDYIAVSPSLWWNGGALSAGAAEDLHGAGFAGRRAWIAFDEPAPPPELAARERAEQAAVEAAFRAARPPGLSWTVVRPGDGHAAIYHPAAVQAFRALFGRGG
jgi:uncharacterized protein